MSDVDFWGKGLIDPKDMELRQKRGLYPPRVSVNFIPKTHHEFCTVSVAVSGSNKHLNSEINLPLGEYIKFNMITKLMLAIKLMC